MVHVWSSKNECFIECDAATMHHVADDFEKRSARAELQNIIDSIYKAAVEGNYEVHVNGPLHQSNIEWLKENNFNVSNGPTAIISW